MKTIIHLSDIHFGRVDYQVVNKLIETAHEIKPDVVVVSGDLTQRARSSQFVEARAFLDALPRPQIVVPGNHDIPLYHVFNRFARPLDKFRRFITEDLEPFYSDDELAIIGVNTARSLTTKHGRINERQIIGIKEKLCKLPDDVVKIVVTHHPFDLPAGFEAKDIVGRAAMAIKLLSDCGADIFLAGHMHISHIGNTAERYKIAPGLSALVVQAGTATSTRGRGESNSFNIIRAQYPRLIVERLEWQPEAARFSLIKSQEYNSTAEGWKAIAA
jgi:3',5'-cyclic AMP phosphodiesterase CpdA